jgi:uncharacterized YigZ family protein
VIRVLSIQNSLINTIIIQKSKFICKLIPIQTITDIKKELNQIKSEFPDATHYCYAYICGSEIHVSDDGEPSGTAGMPILNVLQKQNLNYILAIVIRYFGGIKLGAGGLVRAYSNATIEALKKTVYTTLVPGKLITCSFSYSVEKQVEYLLSNAQIIEKKYQEKITYKIKIANEELNKIANQIPSFLIEEDLLIAR